MSQRRSVLFLILLLAIVGLPQPCSPQTPRPLTVGSKKFSESAILGEIAAQLIEERLKIPVSRREGLGGTAIAFEALRGADIDLYPEYTGTGLEILKAAAPGGEQATFDLVQTEFERRYGLTWLSPLGFNNTYALAMTESRAQKVGIATLSDLASHQQELHFGSSHEFLNRADGWPGLARAYGFSQDGILGLEHGLAYQALQQGKVDVIDVYSTDGEILAYHLRVLKDDRHFFPPYYAAYLVRQDTLARVSDLKSVLQSLSGKFDDAAMQALNYQVEHEGKKVATVASEFLISHHLIAPRAVSQETRGNTFLETMWRRRTETVDLVGQHLYLTGVAVLLATLVGIPLGLMIARHLRLAEPVLTTVGIIQTIPSLALLAFMIPIPGLGLGTRPAILALFLYALLPIVRNTYTGIRGVDPMLIEAATGMGLTVNQILRLVQLPLAIPTIMAGVRTSAVITIGTATLAAFIGAGGLGTPIVTGLSLNDANLILSGAIPAAVLAVAVDAMLGWVERHVSPRGLPRA